MRFNEIGSEFWDIPTVSVNNNMFPDNAHWYISGRSALAAIISELEDTDSVELPSWCCESMIQPFADAGKTISFYPVLINNGLIQTPSFNSDVTVLMDYFGFSSNGITIPTYYKGVIIRDLTHSLFTDVYTDADYYFGSLRKWSGFITGGFAWSTDQHPLMSPTSADDKYIYLRNRAMKEKSKYIHKQRNDKKYLELFMEAEKRLYPIKISAASEDDIQRSKVLDINTIKTSRRRNSRVLMKHLLDYSLFKSLGDSDCPLFVPILVPEGKRDAFRAYLISHSVYCPIHWPKSVYVPNDNEVLYLYENELSLVCDQRYSEQDMLRIVELAQSFLEG